MPNLYNDQSTISFRRQLRQNQSNAERLLWSKLRSKQMHGYKFFRQYSVEPYVLDFFCPDRRLAVELDGGQHGEQDQIRHDEQRTDFLKQQNIKVIRFWNNEVLTNLAGVLEKISDELERSS